MSEIENILKDRIKEERLNLGLNQNELASKLGLTNKSISRYEKGDRQPDYETLSKLADIFDCSIDYLLGRTNDRDNLVYGGLVEGKPYTLEIDRSETDLPDTIDKFQKLIKKLESIGFNVDKLLDEEAQFDLTKD